MRIKTLIFSAFAILLATLGTVQAQNMKIGFTNVTYVVTLMPESKQVEADLKAYGQQLENQLRSKEQALQQKYKAYQQGGSTMSEAVRADMEREIRSMQEQLVQFQKDAEEELRAKEEKMLEPILEKVDNAIKP